MQRNFQFVRQNVKNQFVKRFVNNCQKSLVITPKSGFFNQKWVVHTKDDNQLNAKKGQALSENVDSTIIKDFDDKFGLAQISDPAVILAHLQECQFSYSMNDLIFFLRKLVQMHRNFKPFKDNKQFKALIREIKDRLEHDRHEQYPLIGSYAKCFKDLEVYDKKLWELLEYKMNEDQWYTNFKESLFALEGFTVLQGTGDQKRIDILYEKIERIVNLTIWDQQMTDYKRIVEALAEVNRFDPVIFAKIEMHILRNMSLDYDLKTIVDILNAFGKGDIGQREFYDAVQTTIYKGHLFNRSPMLKMAELPFNGETTSKLLSIFSHAKHRIEEFELNPNFVVYVYKMLMSKSTKFNLANLVDTLKHLSKFKFDDQKNIEDHLVNQIEFIEGKVYFQEIQYAIEYLNYKQCGKYEEIPLRIRNKLYSYIVERIPDSAAQDVIEMYDFMLKRHLLEGEYSKVILGIMINYLNDKMLQIDPKEIEQLLIQIEEHIKLITQDETAQISSYATYQNKIKDYLLVCQFTRREQIEDQSKQDEIPRISHKYDIAN